MSEQNPQQSEQQKQREVLFRHNDLEDPVIQVLLAMDLQNNDEESDQ